MCCELIGWGFFGLFTGALARLLWPGRLQMGLFMTMLLGIVGSVIGGMLGALLFKDQYEPAGYIMSVIGAILFLWVIGARSYPNSLD